ncbi:hypothetical protein ACIXC0_15330 [Bacteroides fragilis]|nr:hypothetical protein [Bacteroides fragilis]
MHKKQELSEEVERERKRKYPAKKTKLIYCINIAPRQPNRKNKDILPIRQSKRLAPFKSSLKR